MVVMRTREDAVYEMRNDGEGGEKRMKMLDSVREWKGGKVTESREARGRARQQQAAEVSAGARHTRGARAAGSE